ncbi:PSD1 and planctomycete cytochrome C domain-containing protein [Tundrisphaera sp. TA3]|uniref:PSD1 and planctomycete cytochrome C domain-containing protein n=1 Tax=Tundrisphaera sp. TA3 TaxID=3435775 RepID=UPI003EBA29D7
MPHDRTRFAFLAAALVALMPGPLPAQPAADFEAFEKEVRPLLIEQCAKCHGAEKQKAGFRVDSRQSMLDGGDSGPAVVAGKPGESLLIEAVRQDGDLKMPPDRKLSPDQIAALERWVAAGAPWPADPAPAVDRRKEAWANHWAFRPVADPRPPLPRDASWCRTPVDAFIKQGLEAKGLDPSPPLDRARLIRRVTYDLTGLPPTPEEVRAFVADESPDAYEKLVDRLLASKHYGEQWARHWLDVARYADTKGYVYGREERFLVQAPAYRDWVVDAFNADLPYDRFLLDQIAADQAEPENPAAQAAMGFLTVGRRFLGVTHDILDDRIDVLTRGTMGMTVACARCHDHKYDPIPTADYYSLYGVFQNCTERLVPVAAPETQDEAYAAFEKELDKRREAMRKGMEASRAEASKRVRARIPAYLMAQMDLSKIPQEGFDTVLGPDDLNPAFVRRWQAHLARAAKEDDPIFRPWRRFSALPAAEFADRAKPETEALTRADAPPLNRKVAEAFATPPASLQEVADRYGKLFAEVDRPESLPDPDAEALRQVLYADRGPCVVPDEPIVTTEWFFDSGTVVAMWKLQGEVDRWLIQSPKAPPYGVALVDRDEIREARIFKRGSPANRGDEVPRRFLQAIAGPDRKPFAQGSGRLELARAIVDPSNPLTARVWVNRIWMHHFGAGLVRTPSDFGIRAEAPSHPELLDWLARRLVDGGWSTKAIHRLILLSAAYQQQSSLPEDAAIRERASKVDPENRLLWRMNPHRLTFEEARDTLLAVTGEIDLRLGGRPSELFPATGTNPRRSLYGTVDRQFLPSVFRAFDFANPDLHIPARSETTVPQQALFAMNHPFVADRARALAKRLPADDPDRAIRDLFQAAYQRDPTDVERRAALDFLAQPADESAEPVRPETLAWQYGYGAVDPAKGPAGEFLRLPHFNGSAWGGGERWPDPKLGWVQITAQGGHPGDDHKHATIRRWVAPKAGRVEVHSTLVHAEATGDGVRGWLVSSRQGVLKSAPVHNGREDFNADSIAVEPGDTIDFVVDIRDGLNSDQHTWTATVRELGDHAAPTTWDSARDFSGPPRRQLEPWEQLAQVVLMANELMFVD